MADEPNPNEKPNPLAPGGERFTEVYANWKTAEREIALKDQEIAALKAQGGGAAQQQQNAQPQQKFYTEEQLQAWVDAGQITPAKMAAQLAWQGKEQAKVEIRQETAAAQKFATAADEVKAYMTKVDALKDERSPTFTQVKRAAFDIADELGLTIQDPRVQRRALREVLGTLEKVDSAQGAVERSRRTDGIPVDGGAAGAGGFQGQHSDPALKDVPAHYIQHWTRLGYSPEAMAEEAKFISVGLARRSGRRPQ